MNKHQRLQEYTELAQRGYTLAKKIAREVSSVITAQQSAIRDGVSIGLYKKMFFTFGCLIDDAKRARSESMHHLKTLTEGYIYFRWVKADNVNAWLTKAKCYQEKASYFRENPDYPSQQAFLDSWEGSYNSSIKCAESEWKKANSSSRDIEGEWKKYLKNTKTIKGVAKEGNSLDIYNTIYKAACEPSHFTDLGRYISTPGKPISLKRHEGSVLDACLSLHYSVLIMSQLMSDISVYHGLSHDKSLETINIKLCKLKGS